MSASVIHVRAICNEQTDGINVAIVGSPEKSSVPSTFCAIRLCPGFQQSQHGIVVTLPCCYGQWGPIIPGMSFDIGPFLQKSLYSGRVSFIRSRYELVVQ